MPSTEAWEKETDILQTLFEELGRKHLVLDAKLHQRARVSARGPMCNPEAFDPILVLFVRDDGNFVLLLHQPQT